MNGGYNGLPPHHQDLDCPLRRGDRSKISIDMHQYIADKSTVFAPLLCEKHSAIFPADHSLSVKILGSLPVPHCKGNS